ncbi:ADAM 17-like protease [Caerostris extrusa]|uniref:ADAM 17-like protease n=1 Tax=Caerostris extrusa TaxID=172846 RepID=A0AAV4NK58_CAEEX|nr:ADAM 17-like protease [Caerostris extrusa]
MYRAIIILFIIVVFELKISSSHYQLKYYEILKSSDIGRQFRLMLNPSKGLLSSQFKAFTIDKDGQKRSLWVDKDNFLEGRVFGETDTHVSAHIDDGVLTAAIKTTEDTYIIEPSWRHLSHDDNSSMIVYRGSDVKYSWETLETGKKL